jgi:TatD DNase family protein
MKLQYIDTHTHIYDEAFDRDMDDVTRRALEANVTKMILPSVDSSSYDRMIYTASRLKDIAFTAAGLHPTSVDDNWEKELEFASGKISSGKHIAVGEVGIDTYWSKEYLKEQITVFEEQIRLAAKYNLPLIIHSREATGLILDVLERNKNLRLRGVFHAYSGSIETFSRISSMGDFLMGIGGVVTFKNSKVKSVVRDVDISSIILETDSPWLTPHPLRGKRNEPSYIPMIAREIADLKQLSEEEVSVATTNNAKKMFGI